MAIIHGYNLETEWTNVARGAFAFGTKDGKRYFIKKLPSPRYPDDPRIYDEVTMSRKVAECAEFERERNTAFIRLSRVRSASRCLAAPVGLFREGPSYYLVYNALDLGEMSAQSLNRKDSESIFAYMRCMADALGALAKAGIVHGDIKPSNVLIDTDSGGFLKRTDLAVMVDFDDCYLSGHPPEDREAVVGTPEYYSPELARYIRGKGPASDVTCASDMYAMGALFFFMYTGRSLIPEPSTGKTYRYEVDFADLELLGIPRKLRDMLAMMMAPNPALRPSPDKLREMIDDAAEVCGDDRPYQPEPTSIRDAGLKGYRVLFSDGSSALYSRDEAAEIARRNGLSLPSAPPEPSRPKEEDLPPANHKILSETETSITIMTPDGKKRTMPKKVYFDMRRKGTLRADDARSGSSRDGRHPWSAHRNRCGKRKGATGREIPAGSLGIRRTSRSHRLSSLFIHPSMEQTLSISTAKSAYSFAL